MTKSQATGKISFAAIFVILFVTFAMGELASRLVYSFKDEILSSRLSGWFLSDQLHLDPYEEIAEGHGHHWRLKAGFRASTNDLNAAKKADQKWSNVLENEQNKTFRINSQGFRGPEIKADNAETRILMLGDSVTFGLLSQSYPDVVRQVFMKQGNCLEVINGGVEGYAIRNLLIEMPRYLEMKPDVVTILVGWNDLFSRNPFEDRLEKTSRLYWLTREAIKGFKRIIGSPKEIARELYSRPKTDDSNHEQLRKAEQMDLSFSEGLETIVQKFSEQNSQVILMTLPGLFDLESPASAKALKIGHLPAFTQSPHVLAKMTEVYNRRLLDMANELNIQVIDLAKWSVNALVPKDRYYIDSVHLNREGLKLLGEYIAIRLGERE